MPLVSTSLGNVLFMPVQLEAPMTETLGWYTDVMISDNGAESRLAMSQQGRQAFVANAPANSLSLVNSMLNLAHGNFDSRWAIPHWGEVQPILSIDAGTNRVACDTRFVDLREGGLVLLWGTSCALGWQIATIDAINEDYVELDGEPLIDAGLVVPLRIGRLRNPMGRLMRGYNATYRLGYDVDDLIELPSADPTQFLGNDIYFDEIYSDDDGMSEDLIASIEAMDDDIGVTEIIDKWDYDRPRRQRVVLLDTLEDVWNFRLWLHRRLGRYKAYWEPTFYNDIRNKSIGAVTTSITAWPDERLAGSATDRDHVAIQKLDGTWLTRTITSVVPADEDNVTVNFNTSIAMNGSDIARISYLGLKRLDSDTIDLEWANRICRAQFNVVEYAP